MVWHSQVCKVGNPTGARLAAQWLRRELRWQSGIKRSFRLHGCLRSRQAGLRCFMPAG